MRRGMKSAVLAALLLLCVKPAHSLTLLSENFTGQTVDPSGALINLVTPSPADDNLGRWIDFGNWAVVPSGDSYALHSVSSDETNLLYYGIDVSGLSLSGTSYTLEFDYVAENRAPERIVLAGMNYGEHCLDPFAPWLNPEDAALPWPPFPYNVDGEPFLDYHGTYTDITSSWRSLSFTGIVPEDYDVLVVAFAFGGRSEYTRALDNVELSVSVPEPGVLLLLGLGLTGLAGVRRRIKK